MDPTQQNAAAWRPSPLLPTTLQRSSVRRLLATAALSTLLLTVLPARAEQCRCSTIEDFPTTVGKIFANPGRARGSIVVDAEVVKVPEKHPVYGYYLSGYVVLKILKVHRGFADSLDLVRLRFGSPGLCDPHPQLFENHKRYMMVLEAAPSDKQRQKWYGDDPVMSAAYDYTGTSCELAMVQLSPETPPPPLPPARAVLPDGGQVPVTAPLFLIGVDKTNRNEVGRPRYKDCAPETEHCFALHAPELERPARGSSLQWDIGKRFRERKSMFVSHVLKLTPPPHSGNATTTVLYNVDANDRKDAFNRSWAALKTTLRDAVIMDIDASRATHVIVFSTGWNTSQAESLQNYSDWIHQLNTIWARDRTVRPVYIGWSWPSQWNSRVISQIDYQNKAHDADEVGLMWANVLVNEVIPDIRRTRNVRVVLVGHSFGARLLTRAMYSWPLIARKCPAREEAADLFIGLQGAFSYRRFVERSGSEGYPYAGYAKCATQVAMTASAHDDAVKLAPASIVDGQFMGSMQAYEATRNLPGFTHIALDSPELSKEALHTQMTVVDASRIIRPPAGHNDVYNADVAALMAELIAIKAPSPEARR